MGICFFGLITLLCENHANAEADIIRWSGYEINDNIEQESPDADLKGGKQLTHSAHSEQTQDDQGRITCPGCGFLLARTLPGASARGLLLYCRKCRKQIAVNIPKPEP